MADEANPKPAKVKIREPLRRPVSDAEILRMFEAEEADQFYIDPDVVPAGFEYEWKRLEVYGKDDRGYEAELLRHGWVPVQHEDHPGYFGPRGLKGHVTRMGQGLYSMDSHSHSLRKRYQYLKAKETVLDQEASIGLAPPGTAERKHPGIRPSIKTEYEPGPNDLE